MQNIKKCASAEAYLVRVPTLNTWGVRKGQWYFGSDQCLSQKWPIYKQHAGNEWPMPQSGVSCAFSGRGGYRQHAGKELRVPPSGALGAASQYISPSSRDFELF